MMIHTKKIFFILVLCGTMQVIESAEQSANKPLRHNILLKIIDKNIDEQNFADEDDDDTEFADAQEGPTIVQEKSLTFNEKMANVHAQYPADDAYTGYDTHLDRKRANIIKALVDCYSQLFVFPEKTMEYQIKLRILVKKYEDIQQQRRAAMQKKQERKQRNRHDSDSGQTTSSDEWNSGMQESRTNHSDVEDDFADYESLASSRKASSRDFRVQRRYNNRYDDGGSNG